jgi:hypothetical protein
MALTPGTRLGPYEVIAAIGAGGTASAKRDLRSQLWRGLAVAQARIWQ